MRTCCATVLGFDNRPFVDSLRALGFHVPTGGQQLRPHDALAALAAERGARLSARARAPRGANDPTLVNAAAGARAASPASSRRRGYRYVLFPSSWWCSTRTSPLADSVVHVWRGFELDRELGRTEFRRALDAATLLDYVHRDEPVGRRLRPPHARRAWPAAVDRAAGVRLRARAEPALALRVRPGLPACRRARRDRAAHGSLHGPAPVPEPDGAGHRGPPDSGVEGAAGDPAPGRPRHRACAGSSRAAPVERCARHRGVGAVAARSAPTICRTVERRPSATRSPSSTSWATCSGATSAPACRASLTSASSRSRPSPFRFRRMTPASLARRRRWRGFGLGVRRAPMSGGRGAVRSGAGREPRTLDRGTRRARSGGCSSRRSSAGGTTTFPGSARRSPTTRCSRSRRSWSSRSGSRGWSSGPTRCGARSWGRSRGWSAAQGAEAVQAMIEGAAKPSSSILATVIGVVDRLPRRHRRVHRAADRAQRDLAGQAAARA